ncbi:hypothetical protein ACR6HW_08820 [Fusibacter sp. JL298sf-3]
MELRTVKIELQNYNGHGFNQNKVLFRLTELKALLRSTFREFFKFDEENAMDDVIDKQKYLFGSTQIKAPVSFISAENLTNNTFSLLLRGKPDILQFYIDLLRLSSLTGSIGKGARSNKGTFFVTAIDGNPCETDFQVLFSKLISKDFFSRRFEFTNVDGGKDPVKKVSIELRDFKELKISQMYELESYNAELHYARYFCVLKDLKPVIDSVKEFKKDFKRSHNEPRMATPIIYKEYGPYVIVKCLNFGYILKGDKSDVMYDLYNTFLNSIR